VVGAGLSLFAKGLEVWTVKRHVDRNVSPVAAAIEDTSDSAALRCEYANPEFPAGKEAAIAPIGEAVSRAADSTCGLGIYRTGWDERVVGPKDSHARVPSRLERYLATTVA
jgi:hypothetical protein